MGRIEKQKILLIERLNKRLLGETINMDAFNRENLKNNIIFKKI